MSTNDRRSDAPRAERDRGLALRIALAAAILAVLAALVAHQAF